MVVIQGRRTDSLGMTFWETTDLLLSLGCHDAMMLDGGGSSGLVLDGVLVNARPSNEPAERSVPNHFSVLYTPEFNSECVAAPNGRSCSGATLQLCQGGQLEESDCSFFGAVCEEGEGTAYCVHPTCTDGGFDSLCVDATVLGSCSYGQLTEVDCSLPFGLHCAEDQGEGFCTDPRCSKGPNSNWCDGEVAKTCTEGGFAEIDCALHGLTCLAGECLDEGDDDDDSAEGDDDDSGQNDDDDTTEPPDEDSRDGSAGCGCSVVDAGGSQHLLLLALGVVALWRGRRSAGESPKGVTRVEQGWLGPAPDRYRGQR